jgi:hypothetical protein
MFAPRNPPFSVRVVLPDATSKVGPFAVMLNMRSEVVDPPVYVRRELKSMVPVSLVVGEPKELGPSPIFLSQVK